MSETTRWHRHHNSVVCRADKCRMIPSVTRLFPPEPISKPSCGDPFPHSHPLDCKAVVSVTPIPAPS